MGGAREIWEGVTNGERIRRLCEHERHGWAQKDDVRIRMLCQVFSLEISFEEGDKISSRGRIGAGKRGGGTLPRTLCTATHSQYGSAQY